jgi:hypothetical protein
MCKVDESRFMVIEIKDCLDYKKNLNIMKELNTQSLMEFIEKYRYHWKGHVL